MADTPFSMSNMLNALERVRFSNQLSSSIPPPGFVSRATDVNNTRLNALYYTMTSQEITPSQFKDTISNLNRSQLHLTVSMLTADPNYFLTVVKTKNGSHRTQKLLGKSNDLDGLFYAVILRRFLHVFTDKYASYVARRALLVFEGEMKRVLYKHVIHHALDMARDQHGCIALSDVITDVDDVSYRKNLLHIVAEHALCLSNDQYGNFVVQHVLSLYDLRCTMHVAISLRGHCVDLSLKKYGSYIVEKLLWAEESTVVVVEELLECEGHRLMRLARSQFGNFVVSKALIVTKDMANRIDLFRGLVHKLMPFVDLLRRSHGSSIANMLMSCTR
ncbi:unnamed protein product [Cochlearia groenlandica]